MKIPQTLKVLFHQWVRFFIKLQMPLISIIAICYFFNYYFGVMLFHWSSQQQFQSNYILIVIGLLVVGEIFVFIFLHLFLGLLSIFGVIKLNFTSEKDILISREAGGIHIIDYLIGIFGMIIIEIPFWLYYHSTTYLFSNLLTSFLTTLYLILLWRDNIIRAKNHEHLSYHTLSMRPLSDKIFKLTLFIVVSLLFLVGVITYIDTLTYFNSI